MRHSRKSRRAFSLPDVIPFIVGGAAILVAVPLAILLGGKFPVCRGEKIRGHADGGGIA